ncbi:MAG: TetR/AcrR family transcriptional regulator [Saprospiraceae bacterium]|nr:TetR/AcrR family transcriptional regulator [Saprospiraceae bacterium]
MDCAEAIMIREGMDALNMDTLATNAGMAKGTLYLYFNSKEDVIAHLTVRARKTLMDAFAKEIAKHEDPLDQIRAILWANFNYYRTNKLHHDLNAFYDINKHLDNTEALRQMGMSFQQFIVSVIEKAKAQQRIKSHINEQELSFMMWGMSFGMLQLMETKSGLMAMYIQRENEVFYKNFIDIFIEGIKT